IGFGEDLTLENILKRIQSYDIFKAYCSNFKEVGKNFASELRDDPNPSCVINYYQGDLMYKDFGDNSTFRAIDYVKYKYSINFFQVLEKINADFNLNLGVLGISPTVNKKCNITPKKMVYSSKKTTVITKQSREFNSEDISFWGQFGISIDTLKKFDVEAISAFWVDDILNVAAKYSYCYNFYWEKGVFRRKIYQPFDKIKWAGNGGLISQGEGMLPKSGDLLIITKSLKDVMTLYETGFTSIAPPSESTFLPIEYYEKQNNRFDKIILLFDNDSAGVKMSRKFSKQLNIPCIFIPSGQGKDISDFVKNNNKELGKELINNLIYETELQRSLQ
ncbi:MAG: hypothetical protein HGA35_07135, partial [Erysipelotrichaceae bacterium]|nr:hypothetical protein [Erysipelotrichaceae bacterium]